MPNLIYVDNSNVWIEGMHVSAVKNKKASSIYEAQTKKITDKAWSYDFGKLLYFAGGEKVDIKRAILFGSRPPKNDTLWSIAEKDGFKVVVYDRSISNREKKIDTDITATIMEDSYEIVDQAKDEIILIAGDKDYIPLIEKVKRRKIKFVVCFWDHAAKEIREICDEFIPLNPYLEHIRYTTK